MRRNPESLVEQRVVNTKRWNDQTAGAGGQFENSNRIELQIERRADPISRPSPLHFAIIEAFPLGGALANRF